MPSEASAGLPAFHDDYILGYCVDAEARRLDLRISSWQDGRVTHVVFIGLAGHALQFNAWQNIVFALQEVSFETLLAQFGAEIRAVHRMNGEPELNVSADSFPGQGLRAFTLDASLGLQGWIIARGVDVIPSVDATGPA